MQPPASTTPPHDEAAPPVSTLGCAILGLLARTELTGYDIARRMDRPVGYVWTAGHSQIYPELARLESRGLVRHVVVVGAGPRPTKRYAVTGAGRAALESWVVAPAGAPTVREPELLRVWSLWTVSAESGRSVVEAMAQRHRLALADLRPQHEECRSDPRSEDVTDPQFASLLTLEAGIRSHEATLQWCDWVLDRFSGA